MSISARIDHWIEEVKNDQTGGSVAEGLRVLAADAILKGVTSAEWKTLMANFTDEQNPAQLARLTFDDDRANDPAVVENVIYLAASAACGAATITSMKGYVNPAVLDMTVNCPPVPDSADAPQPGGGGDEGGNT